MSKKKKKKKNQWGLSGTLASLNSTPSHQSVSRRSLTWGWLGRCDWAVHFSHGDNVCIQAAPRLVLQVHRRCRRWKLRSFNLQIDGQLVGSVAFFFPITSVSSGPDWVFLGFFLFAISLSLHPSLPRAFIIIIRPPHPHPRPPLHLHVDTSLIAAFCSAGDSCHDRFPTLSFCREEITGGTREREEEEEEEEWHCS